MYKLQGGAIVITFLIRAHLQHLDPFLQVFDRVNLLCESDAAKDLELQIVAIRFAPASDPVSDCSIEWKCLERLNAVLFCTTLSRLIDFHLIGKQYHPRSWARVASREGCQADVSRLGAVLKASAYVQGVNSYFERTASASLRGQDYPVLDDGETLFALQAPSAKIAAQNAAYIVFWQIIRKGTVLFTCRCCKRTFIARGRLECSSSCQRKIAAKIAKKNRKNRGNRERIIVMIGVLYQWRHSPRGHWMHAVLSSWHELSLSLKDPGSIPRCVRPTSKAWVPRHSPFLRDLKIAAYESLFSSPRVSRLLGNCTPVRASLDGNVEVISSEMKELVRVLDRLFPLIRECDQILLRTGNTPPDSKMRVAKPSLRTSRLRNPNEPRE